MDGTRKSSRQTMRIISMRRLLALIIGIHVSTAGSQSREFMESQMEAIASRYCDFRSSERMYNITDLLQCMNELASTAVAHSRIGRSPEDRDYFLSPSRRDQSYPSANYRYPRRQSSEYPNNYERRPTKVYSGQAPYQAAPSGYYDGAYKYPYPTEQPFGFPGGVGAGLFDALASISQYDDLKCVSRILCEVATGVIPGSSGYKQNYDGGNSLISLLTALGTGETSPLWTFGKSVLTGYTNRGNPGICYREYPKCPRSNAKLVNYLNNHNGGFFRFFNNVRGGGSQGSYYRGTSRREQALPPGISGPEADRTGTGELKFDSPNGYLGRDFMKSFFPERKDFNDSDRVTFPQEPLQGEQSLNRVSKSLMGYQDPSNDYQSSSFFPQDRKDSDSNTLYMMNPSVQHQNRRHSPRMTGSRKARLYLPDDPTNETTSTFTFPDGQKVRVNVAFSKLFSESYKKALRRSFANDHSPQPINMDGFSMINLVELFSNDRTRLELQVVHPCDMVCHDSKGAIVQFNQILLHSGSLSTLMAPDQPILDLSNALPCEIMCIDRRGERRQLSTSLNQVLRSNYDQQPGLDMTGFQDNWEIRKYRSLNQPQRLRRSESRKVRQNIAQRQPQRFREHHTDNELPVIPSKDHGHSRSQPHALMPRDIGQTEDKANSINTPDKAASVPQGSILFGDGPMPFFGSPIPFMGIAEVPRGSSAFFPQGSSDGLGLAIQSLPIPMPMQQTNGILQSLGMLLPGIMPVIDPIAGEMSPQRILMMCGGDLYFMPFEIVVGLPICAIILGNGNSTDPELNPDLSNPQTVSNPNLSNPETISKPDHSNPQTILKPDLGNSPAISKPDISKPQGISKPDHSSPQKIPTPDLDRPQTIPKPDLSNPQTISEPEFSEPQIISRPDLSNPQTISNPDQNDPQQMFNPDLINIQTTTRFSTDQINPAHPPSNEDRFIGVSESPEEISMAITQKFRPPEGEDYPQQSCLEGESWNLDTHECVPIKYDPDIELDYMHLPGSPWSGVTKKPSKTHKLKKRKKLVLITDKGNITYIKAA